MKQKTLLFIFTLLSTLTASAQLVGGIYYIFDADTKQATVTSGNGYYSGSVTIPATVRYNGVTYTVKSIEDHAFYLCYNMTSVNIPKGVISIGANAFYGCSALTSITIPNSVTKIGEYAFDSCSGLTKVTIPTSVTSIGKYAFFNCSGLTKVTIQGSVTSIEEGVFYNCFGLTSVSIPNSVTSIGNFAFEYCSLTSLIIPGSVTLIGDHAFYSCSSLTNVYCYAEEMPNTYNNAFEDSPISSATLHVPAATVKTSKTTVPWSRFGNIVALQDSDPQPGYDPEPTPEALRGDFNGDGEIGMPDVMFLMNKILNGKFPDEE